MTIDRVVLHDSTYTTLLLTHLEAKQECDALLLGTVRKHHRNIHDDSADNVATCTTEASILTALCMPRNLKTDSGNKASVDRIVQAIQNAPSECNPQDATLLGWAPLRRKTGPGKLSAADRTFAKSLLESLPSIHSKIDQARMGASSKEEDSPRIVKPLICIEFGLQNQSSDPTPAVQMDLVASEIQAPQGSSSRPQSAKAWGAVIATRRPVSVNCLRSFGVQEEYQSFRPHVASALPFVDPSHLAGLHLESMNRAQTMHKFTWTSCDAIRHKAKMVWHQEQAVAQLEAYVRDFEGQVAAAHSNSALAADQTVSAKSAEQ